MEGTFWALVPTLAAVVIAMITKEVYVSLIVGILTGVFLIAANPLEALNELFVIMAQKTGADIGSEGAIAGLGNAGILIFIAELGILVSLLNKSGGTAALSYALTRKIKSPKGALLVTAGLGCMIFMDDYFNRLAVGTIMRPVTDKFGLSHLRLAHIVGSVSLSVCILVPISSWASAITGNISEGMDNAFNAYLCTLTCNFYPILTLAFLFISSALSIDPIGIETFAPKSENAVTKKPEGNPLDLILPIAMLIACSIAFMTLYGSETALAISGAVTLAFCLILYLPRKVMTLKQFAECFSSGFKSIADVILILILAWTLTGVCERLDVGTFIGGLTSGMGSARSLLPAIMFVVAMGTAFATGTAWGTFGMLVPLVVPMFEPFSTLQILTVSAVLSGSVFGNQVSPISDSTLLTSKVCECDHMKFVKSQLPVSLIIAFMSLCGFLTAGVSGQIWAGWISSLAVFASFIVICALKRRPQHKKMPIAAIKKVDRK